MQDEYLFHQGKHSLHQEGHAVVAGDVGGIILSDLIKAS
jgi:hypothetical protein